MLYTIIDIETNGRSHLSDVLEVGYMRVNKRMEVIQKGQFYFYKPEWEIENQAQSVHGLQRSFLRAQCPDDETFRENLVKLYTLMTRGVIVGKRSNKFDIQCYSALCQRIWITLLTLTCMGLWIWKISTQISLEITTIRNLVFLQES